MKKAEKIISLSIITLAVIFGSVHIFLNLLGKPILIRQLENLTHKKTTLRDFTVSPLLHLEIGGLNIEGLAKIERVSVSPSIPGFLTGKIIFNSLIFVRPELSFTKNPAPVVDEGKSSTDLILPSPVLSSAAEPKTIRVLPLAFKRIKIEGGKIDFIDQSLSADGIKVTLKNIKCNISNLYFFHRPVISTFEFKGRIPWKQGEAQGRLELDGWLNYAKRDMRATLKISNIDAIYLYPYYSTWVDLDKARIEKAKLNFSSDINGLNNNVTAECRLELSDIVRKPLEPGEAEDKASRITNKVLDMFKSMDEGKVELNFTIKTKMDSPRFGFGNLKMAFEDKIVKGRSALGFKPESALVFPVKVMESGVKSFTDLTRAMIAGVFAIGAEVGKSAGAALERN